jgi:succinoglycan biosynthesis transport protein ExoP
MEFTTLNDYLAVLRRRKGRFFAVALPILAISVGFASGLPSIYQSTATILIEQQDIPTDLVETTITSYAEERIQAITQRVMTRRNLDRIIKKFKRVDASQSGDTLTDVRDKLKDSIAVEMVSADVFNPKFGRPQRATIAFTITYEDTSRDSAQVITKEIVDLYLAENRKDRVEQAEQAEVFLRQEAQKVKTHIAEIEKELADFKEKHLGALPDQVEFNLRLIERTDGELRQTQQEIRALEERRIYLQSELAQLSPYAANVAAKGDQILSPQARLQALYAQYSSLSGRYSSAHPDVVRVKKEIEVLEKQLGAGGNNTMALEEELQSLREQLATARQRYSDEHPDVKRLERAVVSAEAKMKAGAGQGSLLANNTQATNPAYIQLRASLEAADTDLRALKSTEATLKAKLASYEDRVTRSPQVERTYQTLMREHQNATERYSEISAKLRTAVLAKSLESEQKGERFVLIEEPALPEAPIKPNRAAILFLGVVLSLAGGLGASAIAETLDSSVRDRKALTELLGTPPLVAIPYIETKADIQRSRWLRIAVLSALFVGVAGAALWLHFRAGAAG